MSSGSDEEPAVQSQNDVREVNNSETMDQVVNSSSAATAGISRRPLHVTESTSSLPGIDQTSVSPQLVSGVTSSSTIRDRLLQTDTLNPLTSRTVPNTIIKTPGRRDILCGRGKPFQNHSGNVWMRRLVAKRKAGYDATPRNSKGRVTFALINDMHRMGGRFLRPLAYKKRRLWAVADTAVVFEKVAHSFRTCKVEGATIKNSEKDITDDINEVDLGRSLGQQGLREHADGVGLGGSLTQPKVQQQGQQANFVTRPNPGAATLPSENTANERAVGACQSGAVAIADASTSAQTPTSTLTPADLDRARLLMNPNAVALLAMYQQQLSNALMVGQQQVLSALAIMNASREQSLLHDAAILQSLRQKPNIRSGHPDAKPTGNPDDVDDKQDST